jgi:hypothetical protein
VKHKKEAFLSVCLFAILYIQKNRQREITNRAAYTAENLRPTPSWRCEHRLSGLSRQGQIVYSILPVYFTRSEIARLTMHDDRIHRSQFIKPCRAQYKQIHSLSPCTSCRITLRTVPHTVLHHNAIRKPLICCSLRCRTTRGTVPHAVLQCSNICRTIRRAILQYSAVRSIMPYAVL